MNKNEFSSASPCSYPCCSQNNGNGNNNANSMIRVGLMLVPGDSSGNVSTNSRMTVVNMLSTISNNANMIQSIDKMLSIAAENTGLQLLWSVGLDWPFTLKVIPGGTFQPTILWNPSDITSGLSRLMLVPCETSGDVTANHILWVGNTLTAMGVNSTTLQNVNNALSAMLPLSSQIFSFGTSPLNNIWVVKVPGMYFPQNLAMPFWF